MEKMEYLKDFVVTVWTDNYGNNRYSLHKKDECSVTKELLKYQKELYSYDTYEEAKKAHINIECCKYCKSLEEKKATPKEERKYNIFIFIIAIICFAIGYFVSTDTTFGRVMVAIIFAVIGAFLAIIYRSLCELLSNIIFKSLNTKKFFITIMSLLLITILIFTAIKSFDIGGTKIETDPYEDVWNKDPNEWTDDEKEYVDDFFEWQKNQMAK